MLSLVRQIRPNSAISSYVGQCRTLMATKPRVRIPFWEKVALGMVFTVGILAIPSYITFNIKHYRPKPDA